MANYNILSCAYLHNEFNGNKTGCNIVHYVETLILLTQEY